MQLYQHQIEGLEATEGMNHVAYFWDMGLGKTFAGSEKMMQLDADINLVVCQKSKIDDWINHFEQHYENKYSVYDLSIKKEYEDFIKPLMYARCIGIINYDLIWRRPELLKLKDFTLLLDESSLIQTETAKRSKFILKMQPKNVILLSGTPTGGKYEKLWSQMHLLGWNISKQLYWKQFVKVEYLDTVGRSIPIVTGYKNVDRLKRKMNQYGCQFLKTDEVFDLPDQVFQKVRIPASKEYRTFRKDRIVTIGGHWVDYCDESGHMQREFRGGKELVGDTTLTKMLYERMLCGHFSEAKLKAFADLVESTDDRLIVFYNFTAELDALEPICESAGRAYSLVNGSVKDLTAYDTKSDSVTFIQYQAGAMGLNLQKACRMIFFTLPLSSELYEQSKKRIHRIGQNRPCFYYQLICKGSIEEKILDTLNMRQDFTEKLFEKDEAN
jgi:SNF2 family DNA or RNA helicase